VAAAVEEALGVTVQIVAGGRGQFDVLVQGDVVAGKSGDSFPTEAGVIDAVRDALG